MKCTNPTCINLLNGSFIYMFYFTKLGLIVSVLIVFFLVIILIIINIPAMTSANNPRYVYPLEKSVVAVAVVATTAWYWGMSPWKTYACAMTMQQIKASMIKLCFTVNLKSSDSFPTR